MKSFKNLLTLFLAASAMIVMTSCGDDDPIIIDPGTDGINVADGFYISAADGDPVATAALTAESVEDADFASQTRAGFVAGYVYMTAGTYNVVEITDKAKTKSLGATAETVTDMSSDCGFNDYILVNLVEDGAGFNVANEGLYKVTYDQMTGEAILYQIQTAGIIGSATEGGWGADTKLDETATLTADGGSWSRTNITLRPGEFKVRFNCRWNLDRRIDPDAGFGADNAYQFFTNFGGSASNLLPGNDGSNIAVTAEEEAVYTVTLNWTPADGFSLNLEKTGEATPITFVPDEHQWAVTGDATPNGWPDDNDPVGTADTDMNYEGVDNGTYKWVLESIALVPGGFKFRTNDSWDENRGWNELTLTGDTSDFSDDGGNIKVATAASYKITLTTSDDGATYTADFEQL